MLLEPEDLDAIKLESKKRHQAEYKRFDNAFTPCTSISSTGCGHGVLRTKVDQWREERNRCQRGAGAAQKTPPTEVSTIELHLGGRGGGRHVPPTR